MQGQRSWLGLRGHAEIMSQAKQRPVMRKWNGARQPMETPVTFQEDNAK